MELLSRKEIMAAKWRYDAGKELEKYSIEDDSMFSKEGNGFDLSKLEFISRESIERIEDLCHNHENAWGYPSLCNLNNFIKGCVNNAVNDKYIKVEDLLKLLRINIKSDNSYYIRKRELHAVISATINIINSIKHDIYDIENIYMYWQY